MLKKLLFATSLRFSELKPDEDIENNQLVFHLDQLISAGLVSKEDKKYILSNRGKEYANRLDTDKVEVQRQAKISVLVCPMREAEGELEFLMHTRLKQPFYGCQGSISGKVNYGEKVLDSAKRELFEESALKAKNWELVNIYHWHVFDKAGSELLEDKFFYVYRATGLSGKLVNQAEGKCEWIAESKLEEYITKPYHTMDSIIDYLEKVKKFDGNIKFSEASYYTDRF